MEHTARNILYHCVLLKLPAPQRIRLLNPAALEDIAKCLMPGEFAA